MLDLLDCIIDPVLILCTPNSSLITRNKTLKDKRGKKLLRLFVVAYCFVNQIQIRYFQIGQRVYLPVIIDQGLMNLWIQRLNFNQQLFRNSNPHIWFYKCEGVLNILEHNIFKLCTLAPEFITILFKFEAAID